MKISKARALIFEALGISTPHSRSHDARECTIEVLRSTENQITQDKEQSLNPPPIMEATKIQLSYHSKNKKML